MTHSWPGNVRELENVLERALIFNQGHVIEDILFSNIKMNPSASEADSNLVNNLDLPLSTMRDRILARLEHEYLTKLLKKYQGSIKQTAAHAGVDVRTVRRKMKDFDLDKWDFK
jgi:two-component system response regulator HydG